MCEDHSKMGRTLVYCLVLFAFADILEYKGSLVKEYFASRKDLITKVIKENKSEDINLIFVRLEDEEYAKEFTKDRENIALYNSWEDFLKLFKCEYDTNICSLIGGCTLSKEIMLNDRFAEKIFDSHVHIKNLPIGIFFMSF